MIGRASRRLKSFSRKLEESSGSLEEFLKVMLLVIDNDDFFHLHLVQYLGELGAEMRVFRNDEISLDEIENELKPAKILISPGPGTPDDAGISLEVLKKFSGRIPILGVCLGHQAIAQVFGGKVVRAPVPVHGKPVPWSTFMSGLGPGAK